MKKQKNSGFWTKLICWILIGMMLLSVATALIYMLLGFH